MNIQTVDITNIKPYKNNPRKNANAVDAVANSIKEFGFRQPIVLDGNNEIVAGHTRYFAAKKLGLIKIPCVIAADLTEQQIKMYRLADNKTHELSEWDFDLLGIEINDITDFNVSEFGFDFDSDIISGEIQEDDFNIDENIPNEPVSKIGDIYQLGKHRLMCGDSTNKNHVDMLMNNLLADLIVTDPPYNINYRGAGDNKRAGILNDKMSEDEFLSFLSSVFKNHYHCMRDGAAGYCFYKETGSGVFLNALKNSGLKFNQQCVWIKNQAVLGGSLYQGMHEPFILFFKGKLINKIWNGKRKQKSVFEDIDLMSREELIKYIKHIQSDDFDLIDDIVRENKSLNSILHPTMKPIMLLAKFIQNSSNKDNIVLDLFGGSGSTLIACEQLNRVCYMMELDPQYCDVIIKRWEQFTGNKATKIV